MKSPIEKMLQKARACFVEDGLCPVCFSKLALAGEGCYYPDHLKCKVCNRCLKLDGTSRSCRRA